MFKNKGTILGGMGCIWERGGISKKYANVTKFIQKINLCRKSHPNRIMGKCSKIWGMVFGKRGGWGGGEFGGGGCAGISKKKCKHHKCHIKMNLCRKFHPNRTMEKC